MNIFKKIICIVGLYYLNILCTAMADIILDGSVGQQLNLEGPDYHIPAQAGIHKGENLFHSFADFSLQREERAVFQDSPNIVNIISRVTGGKTSWVHGQIQAPAHLYLFNPAGIFFGDGASLDIDGSFYVSTADYLNLGQNQGVVFSDLEKASIFTQAIPSAFGFISESIAPLQIEQADLQLNIGEHLLLAAGGLDMQNSHLIAKSGIISLLSVAGRGELALSKTDNSSVQSWGKIYVSDNSSTDIANTRFTANLHISNPEQTVHSAGRLEIRAGEVLLDNAYVFADTLGEANGQGIYLQADRLLMQNEARLTADVAFKPEIQGRASVAQGGEIQIKTHTLEVNGGSQISAAAYIGSGGNINIQAENLIIKGRSSIHSGIFSNAINSGLGGDISIQTQSLNLLGGGQIRVETQGSGQAGSILIESDNLNINGTKTVLVAATLGNGDAGKIDIHTNNLNLSNEGQIITGSGNNQYLNGSGKGGSLYIKTNKKLQISGADTGLFNNTFTSGAGGITQISAKEILLEHGASIETGSRNSGHAGDILLATENLEMYEGGFISSASLDPATGDAGSINIITGDSIYLKNSRLHTSATQADGGDIHLSSPSYLYLENSEISTSVSTEYGDGGNINLSPKFIVIDNSDIIAQAYEGQGGNIDITTTGMFHFSPEISNNIDASSALGINGVVDISAPEVDLSSMLQFLTPDFLSNELMQTCTSHTLEDSSRLIVTHHKIQLLPNELKNISTE
ncbi:filamentous hemagglutinin N-terminal domain-containing protein [Candidatus Venteria ishoeyi]|uniref:two-partner secretion domain-containing protein n=1 Tax=Candidatus Venteria ishoeyi TaxID=1899563 RepID=UPI0025A5B433|nr:filamentous hemagglutinin N-terminal domain-containing protein [Candidatus Venteria ishoeyi]MDM8546088.1 filamentous hemagglutinin N-terminal domain-containing protein [Candidatus Venteria ishoeyi]